MYNLLKDHAIQYVWSSPSQDYQYIFKPERIGPPSGNMFSVTVHRKQFYLPNSQNVYFFDTDNGMRFSYNLNVSPRPFVVYDLGALPPWLVNLPSEKMVWYPIPELMENRNLDIWLYQKSGLRIPSKLGYIQRIRDNSFLLAVELTSNYPWDLNGPDNDLYIRFYSNAFFESSRFLNGGYDHNRGIDYIGGAYPSEITESRLNSWLSPRVFIQNASADNAKGGLIGFVNGQMVYPVTNLNAFPLNSYVEVIFDRSIYRSVKLPISSLPGFESDLDEKPKRIFVPWLGNKETRIEYHDDVEFFIGRHNRGVYYHRNEPDAVRQLTNESYTLAEQYIEGYIFDNPWLNASDPTFPYAEPYVLARLRHSGYDRELVWEHMHLREMVKLGQESFMDVLTGSLSNVPVWRAEYIENSHYNKIQSAVSVNDFTWQDVFIAYGYNAATRMLLPTDIDAMNNGDYATGIMYYQVPPSYKDATLLVFNRIGELMGLRSGVGSQAIAMPAIPGDSPSHYQHGKLIAGLLRFDATLSSFYGDTVVSNGRPVREQGFACYICSIVSGLPDEDWRVTAEDEGYWSVSADGLEILWDTTSLSNANAYPAVRFNDNVVFQEAVPFQEEEDGALHFNINNLVTRDGEPVRYIERIPYATLLVFVENKLLVEGIDYYIEWPQVVVTKRYQAKQVSLVMFGLTDDTLTRTTVRESGWSYKGVLSVDDRWHLRDDRNVVISYGGNVIHPSLIKAYESYWEVEGFNAIGLHSDVMPYDESDVVPYSVTDIMQTIEPIYPGFGTVEEYHKSLVNDTIIEDYMTEHMDFVLPTQPNTSSRYWMLYSPLISRVIGEMILGWLNDLGFIDEMSTQEVENRIEPFRWLLDYDPIIRGVNLDNATVLPHCYDDPVSVSLNQYMFVKRLIDMYLNGLVNLSTFLVIDEDD